LKTWLARVEGANGERERDEGVTEAATDLVTTLAERPTGVHGALARFGQQLGADGWPLDTVSDWLGHLTDVVGPRQRRMLADLPAHTALAHGWAEGYVRGADVEGYVDPITGAASESVLRARLREVLAECRELSMPPSEAYALVVIDVDTRRGELHPLDVELLMVNVADTVRAVFVHGIMLARVADRLVILAANTETTDDRAQLLQDRLRVDRRTRRAHAAVITESVPAREADIDRVLRDLSAAA
jgi:GGDEF domain-containing protein